MRFYLLMCEVLGSWGGLLAMFALGYFIGWWLG